MRWFWECDQVVEGYLQMPQGADDGSVNGDEILGVEEAQAIVEYYQNLAQGPSCFTTA